MDTINSPPFFSMKNGLINRIIFSGRKTLALEIMPDASLVVRAPRKVTIDRILNLVKKKLNWIFEKQRMVKERYQAPVRKEFKEGEEFLYLGELRKLRIIEEGIEPLVYNETEFLLSISHQNDGKHFFEQWYRKQAVEVISASARRYADMTGLNYSKLRISGAKRRWGSCGTNGTINFSWRLIMAPLNIVDYVVVHELSHLAERNHSRKFWNKVNEIMPSYRQSRKWLREHGHLLSWQ